MSRDPMIVLLVEELRQGQRARWQAGDRVAVEAYLQQHPTLQGDVECVLELVSNEVVLRAQHGEAPQLEEYQRRFPELAARLKPLWAETQPGLVPCTGTISLRSLDPRLSNLLMQWEKSRKQGLAVSAEQLCQDCPELLDALKQQIQDLLDLANTVDDCTLRQSINPLLDKSDRLGVPDYQIIHEVGRGGMGVVYQAFDRRRQRMVALKTLPSIDPSLLYRLKCEFRALADVTHFNLVSLYELISDGRTWFFTMEFVQGVDFLSYVRAEDHAGPAEGAEKFPSTRQWGDWPPRTPTPCAPTGLTLTQLTRLREVLRQLAEGITALHDAGKLHRDIKPSNVLVTKEGRLVLLDFGLAADLEGADLYQSAEQHAVGTAAYMAPEQAQGCPVSRASDWYSVGVMTYEALTGRRPALGKGFQVMFEKQFLDPPAPRTVVPAIPEDLNALCVQLLRRRPEDRPSGHEVLRRLSSEPSKEETPAALRLVQPARTPFVGREQHLATLQDAFRTTRQGRAVTVFVQGRSGLGKSALVQRFLLSLQERDEAVVLAGRCYERESVPYKALDSLVDALSRYLAHLPDLEATALLPRDILALTRVFPVLRRVAAVAAAPRPSVETPDHQELRRRAFTALRELLTRLGDRRPLALFIDDLQWGDLDSALLLSELLRPPDPPVLLLVGSFRSEDRATSPCLRSLLEPQKKAESAPVRHELNVSELTMPEARELALTLLGQDDPAAIDHADAIARESGGNPLFLYELLRSFQATSRPAEPTATGEIILDKVLWARIQHLPVEARNLLEVLAVAGRPLPQASASRAAGLDSEDRALLSLLRTGHLVRGTGPGQLDEIETFHDRIRETVVAHLPPTTLMDHHRRLAHTLEELGSSDPATLAVHFLSAADHDKAGHYYALAAAKAADALAFDRSANLYRLSLELRPVAVAEGRELRMKLADALANAGRGAEAAREYEATAAGAGTGEALECHRRAAYQYLISGHVDAGRAAISTVLKAVGMRLPATPLRALWSLLCHRGWLRLRGLGFRERASTDLSADQRTRLDTCWSTAIGLGVIDAIRAADFQTRSLLLALQAGEPFRITRALALEAIHMAAGGGRTRRQTAKLLKAAKTLAGRLAHPYAQGLVHLSQGATAWLEGRYRDALPCLVQAEETFRNRCTGVAWELDTAQTYRLVTLVSLGEIAELSRLGPACLRQAKERGDLFATTNLSAYIMPLVRLGADDSEGARELLRQAMARWSQEGFHVQHLMALISEAEICLYRGEGLAAWNFVRRQWPAYTASLLTRLQNPYIHALYARARSALVAAAEVVDPQPFWTAAQRDARLLEKEKMPWSLALAGLVRAGLHSVRGDPDGARVQLVRVIPLFDALQAGLHAAAARRQLGRLLGGEEGLELSRKADSWMTAQEIRNSARMGAALVPGFPD